MLYWMCKLFLYSNNDKFICVRSIINERRDSSIETERNLKNKSKKKKRGRGGGGWFTFMKRINKKKPIDHQFLVKNSLINKQT